MLRITLQTTAHLMAFGRFPRQAADFIWLHCTTPWQQSFASLPLQYRWTPWSRMRSSQCNLVPMLIR